MAEKTAKPRGRPAGTKTEIPVPEAINHRGLARFLGISEVWLSKLVQDGILTKQSRYAYDFKLAVQQYVLYREEHAKKKSGTSTTTSAERLRNAKQAEIERRMMRDDRQLIAMDEALMAFDEITGDFISTLEGLPARLTTAPRERPRFEAVCDEARQRLADRFTERRQALRSGQQIAGPETEDDA